MYVVIVANFYDIRQVKSITDNFSKIFEKGIGLHVFFAGILLFVLSIITLSSRYAVSLLPRAIFSFILLMLCVYTGRWICRRWLFKDNWVVLVCLYIIFIAFFSILGVTGYVYLMDFKFDENDSKVFFVGIPGFVIMFLFGGGFVAIGRSARKEQIHGNMVLQQQKESELALLRSQISPHFLFNTLNNLYGLSVTDHEKVPGLLLKLSDLLRYSVYETGQQWFLLDDELAYIRSYIELEKIRMEDRLSLHVQMSAGNGTVRIAQMVLITFVENAFKHSRNTIGQEIRIDLVLSVVDDFIVFTIGNSFGNDANENSPLKDASGVGVGNTIKRLDLLYGTAYSLRQYKENNYYKVDLRLKVK
ncbi:sensor histidine kinase [Chitinophaga sp. RAB17]|uniref:sensor histidine kinase n=1 Tax=Chitinophaga sp. RAB17 TaxID=3233049 RepID=UPI003F90FFFA